MDINDSENQEFEWCIVGNIVDQHHFGETKEIRKGSKYFAPNAKVYCLPEFPGVAHEAMPVVGKPRKNRRLIKITINTSLIKNFRIRKVFKPLVIGYIRENVYYENWKRNNISETDKEKFVTYLSTLTNEIIE